MSKIEVSRGATPLQQTAIDEHLDRLGVQVDPGNRTVNEAGAANSKVKGGLEGLQKAAEATGAPEVLDLEDLGAVKTKMALPSLDRAARWIVGKGDGASDVARAKITGCVMSLQGAGQALENFVSKSLATEEIEIAPLQGVFRRLEKAGDDLGAALDGGNLGHASPAELKALQGAYAGMLDTLGSRGPALQALINKGFLPKARAMAEQHNRAGLMDRITGSVPVVELQAICESVGRFNGTQAKLLDHSDLFRLHPSPRT